MINFQLQNLLINAIYDASPDGILVVDDKGVIVSHNQQFVKIWQIPGEFLNGYEPNTAIGLNDAPILSMALERVKDKQTFLARVQELYNRPDMNDLCEIELLDGRTLERHSTAIRDKHDQSLGRIWFFRDISERKEIEFGLKLNQFSLNHSQDAIFRTGQDARIKYVNDAACQHLGYTREELLSLSIYDIDPDFSLKNWNGYWEKVRNLGWKRFEARHKRKDGTIIPVEIVSNFIEFGGESYSFASVRDITERKLIEDQLRIAAATFETREAILITDASANIIRVNQAFEKITGYSAEEVTGKNPRILSSGCHDKNFYAAMWQELLSTGTWGGEVWGRHKSGNVYPKQMTITAVKNKEGKIRQYVSIFTDISDRKKSESEIHTLAFYDVLTGLPNRRLLLDRLGLALAASARHRQYGALLFLDLDHFKTINDTQGHGTGDALLIEVSQRLKLCVREIDTISRLGGDEFVVLIENISASAEDALQNIVHIAEKVRITLAAPYQLGKQTQHSSASIGVCLFCGNDDTVDELVKRADMAMYQAKDTGRNKVRFFDPMMQQSVEAHAVLESDLRDAVSGKQLQLYYQIQIDHEQQPIGAEALIRWQHPLRGMVSPAQFIPVAEESSLILEIGHWVLDTACQQIAAWSHSELARHLILAINISAQQFKQADFVDQVEALIRKYNIEPSRLKLELTESVALDNLDVVVSKMRILRQTLGVTLSLDDFGTGFSSLSYLKQLPLDQIKIDQSFVRDVTTDSSDAVMVKTIIGMAKNFGLSVIAEGVETESQLAFLKENGCMAYQGYLFSKPVPIEQFEDFLNSRHFINLYRHANS